MAFTSGEYIRQVIDTVMAKRAELARIVDYHAESEDWAEAEGLALKRLFGVAEEGEEALMAALAGHDKDAKDVLFLGYLPVIERYAFDDRNFVRKAVNWAPPNTGKRSLALNKAAVACARRIAKQDSRAARWIAKDALRELTDPKTTKRIKP